MEKQQLIAILRKLNFTKYESYALVTLIEHQYLNAKDISEYSEVPRPKIYETVDKLEKRGFLDVIPKGGVKMFRIKPQEIIQAKLLEYSRDITSLTEKSVKIIDDIYNTGERKSIPFMGIAGKNTLKEYINSLIDTAKETIYSFMPMEYFSDLIISALQKKQESGLDIKLVFEDNVDITNLQQSLPQIEFYLIEHQALDRLNYILNMIIKNKLEKQEKESFAFETFQNIANNIRELIGIMVVDQKKSFFRVPLPVGVPIAILSSLKEIVDFHCKGIDSIIEAAQLIS